MGFLCRAAASLRNLYAAYARRMKGDPVAHLDSRLKSLLGYTTVTSATPAEGTAAAVKARRKAARAHRASSASASTFNLGETLGSPLNPSSMLYDFQRDAVPELCARMAAVLHTFSARLDAVTGVAELLQVRLSITLDVCSILTQNTFSQ